MPKPSANRRTTLKIILPAIFALAFFANAGRVEAATYYIRPASDGGNNSNNCTSHATACATLAGVTAKSPAVGSDAYFLCGGTWITQQTMGWSGTSSNPAVVGAYYGTGTIGSNGTLPIIDGVPTGTGNSKFGTVPARGKYEGLVNISGRSYVRVENLQVQWSGGIGIQFTGGSNNTISGCTLISSYLGGIRYDGTTNEVSYGHIEHNTVSDTGRIRLANGTFPASIGIIGGDPGPPYANNFITQHNYLYDNHGEGIGHYKGTQNNIIEYNTVVNSQSCNIYFDRQSINNTARYNLVYGYAGAPWACSAGICIQDEQWATYGGSYGNKIYGNMVANANYGINFDSQFAGTSLKDTEIYNNTIVDCTTGMANWNGPYENSYVKNNIIYCTDERSPCTLASVPAIHSGLTFDYNLWSAEPIAAVRGANDPTCAAPQISKTLGWNALTRGGVTGSEFALTSGSPARGKGANLGAPYNHLLNLAASNFKTNTFIVKDQPASGAWDIGAGVYGEGGDTAAPGRPSGLSVR